MKIPSERPYVAANVRVTNHSPNALWYHALSAEHPDFYSSQMVGDEWQWSSYTAKPKQWYKLAKGKAIVFQIPLYDDAQALKVGLTFYTYRRGKPTDVWTAEFLVRRPGSM